MAMETPLTDPWQSFLFQVRWKSQNLSMITSSLLVLLIQPTSHIQFFLDTSLESNKLTARSRELQILLMKITQATLEVSSSKLSTIWHLKNVFGSSQSSTALKVRPSGSQVRLERSPSLAKLITTKSARAIMPSKLLWIISLSRLQDINSLENTSLLSQIRKLKKRKTSTSI